MKERWVEVEGTNKQFLISTEGRVKKRKRYKVSRAKNKYPKRVTYSYSYIYNYVYVKPVLMNNGRLMITINGKKQYLHRLVADHFMPPFKKEIKGGGKVIEWINGDKKDCRLSNLRYASPKARKKAFRWRMKKIRHFISTSPHPRGAKAALARELCITNADLNQYIRNLEYEFMNTFTGTDFNWKLRRRGKVRDVYEINDHFLAIISTDRISAFDKVVGHVKGRGQLLTAMSSFWFKQLGDYVDTQYVATPHPNVMIVKRTDPIPVEFIPRGYATGSYYKMLHRQSSEIKQNEKLIRPVMTFTTKAEEGHDETIYKKDIVDNILSEEDFNTACNICIKAYTYGSTIAARAGLVLADTKFELGYDSHGKIILIDEILTPDSSRYWDIETHKEFDKDILRNYLKKHPNSKVLPENLQKKIMIEYTKAYEKITKQKFRPASVDIAEIGKAVEAYV